MRLLLLTAGSRGDVEPFVALPRQAQRRGHAVRLAVPDRSGCDLTGLDAVSLGVDFARVAEGQGVSAWAAARSLRQTVRPLMQTLLTAALRHCLDHRPDVVVHHPKVLSAALAAQHLQVPRVVAEITPVSTPTRLFPAPGVVDVDLGRLNRLTYVAASLGARMFAGELEAARRAVGLPEPGRTEPPQATLVAVSPHLLPRPDDWPVDVHLTGAWAPEGERRLDPVVEDFVHEGPFVYAGFGSMVAGDPRRRARVVVAAARARGLRVLLARGWGGLAPEPGLRGDDLLVVDGVPHAAVLPYADAAVHHGGAGTVDAAARAGTVSVVVPFVADQPFWGRLLHRSGLGPAPVPQHRLDVRRLGRALDGTASSRPDVARVSRAMAEEDGAARACDVVESLVGTPTGERQGVRRCREIS